MICARATAWMTATVACSLAVVCCARAPASPSPAPPPPATEGPARSPLVVAVVVDQLVAWVAAERLPRLPQSGGFARLRREGTWVTDLTYLHAATETAPGHSALFSGCIPRETGIVGNAVWRSDLDPPREGSLLEDPRYRVVDSAGPVLTADGKRPKNGISLANATAGSMPQPWLADRLLAVDPQAVVVALSLKDRGVAFAGGTHPSALVWYDEDAGTLVTSKPDSAPAGDALPTWARPFEHPLEGKSAAWNVLDRGFIEHNLEDVPDDQPGEMPDIGGRTFPHSIAGPGMAKRFRATPMADDLLAALTLAAVAQARRADHPMLVAVSFSANDYVGHTFGPNSWEAWDELEELDATLGRLMAGLDALAGAGGYSVVLSGDHGIVPFPLPRDPAWCAPSAPNPYEKPCHPPTLLTGDDIKDFLNDHLQKRFGRPGLVKAVIEALVFLSESAASLPAAERARLDDAVRAELLSMTVLGTNPVADVFPTSAFVGPCPSASDESVRALVCRATVASRGDFYIVPKEGDFFWGKPRAAPEGASHGTPYRYDRTVPLLVRYPGGPGGQVVARAPFGSYYASAWYALTGQTVAGPYGSVLGAPPAPVEPSR